MQMPSVGGGMERIMLKIESVQKDYKDFHLNCTMEVQPGRITGLVGQNGAGKTTTFKLILGLIKSNGGSVELFGKKAEELTEKDKERLGVVLSESGFSEYLCVKDVAAFLGSLFQQFDRQKLEKYCEQFELPMNKKIKDFSTGMKVKLKVIAAITHQADLLILDEPTAGLDVVARDELLVLLREYMEADEKRAILISSHISSDLENLCDDIYMIHEGQIVFHEETDALMGEYALLKVSEEQYGRLEKQYLLRRKQEPFGYLCLTDKRQFYLENAPDVVVEKSSIDELILMMIRGEAV